MVLILDLSRCSHLTLANYCFMLKTHLQIKTFRTFRHILSRVFILRTQGKQSNKILDTFAVINFLGLCGSEYSSPKHSTTWYLGKCRPLWANSCSSEKKIFIFSTTLCFIFLKGANQKKKKKNQEEKEHSLQPQQSEHVLPITAHIPAHCFSGKL